MGMPRHPEEGRLPAWNRCNDRASRPDDLRPRDDIVFFRDLDVDMVGMGPYIVHDDTPLASSAKNYDGDAQLNLSLKMIAVARLVPEECEHRFNHGTAVAQAGRTRARPSRRREHHNAERHGNQVPPPLPALQEQTLPRRELLDVPQLPADEDREDRRDHRPRRMGRLTALHKENLTRQVFFVFKILRTKL